MTKREIISAAASVRVLVVGDVMIDRYMYGTVQRRSPEADVPVLLQEKTQSNLGGAANVARNFVQLGCKVELLSVVGHDRSAEELHDLLTQSKVTGHLIEDPSRPTTVKTRVIHGHDHLLRVDFESTHPIEKSIEGRLLDRYNALISAGHFDIIVFQDYNKGLLTPTFIERALAGGRAMHCFIAVDPKMDNFWSYQKVDLFKPNLKESQYALDSRSHSIAGYIQDALEIKKRLNCNQVVVTLSGEGMILTRLHSKEVVHVPVRSGDILDVCGAGDAVLSIVCLLSYMKRPAEDIGFWGNEIGLQVCSKVGVVPLDMDSLNQSSP